MAVPVSVVRWGPTTAILQATDKAWADARALTLPRSIEAAAVIDGALKTANARPVRRITLSLPHAQAVLDAAGVG